MINIVRLHNTGEGLRCIAWTLIRNQESQAIHILKRFACIGLEHADLSLKTTCGQPGICWYSPLVTNKMNFQSGKFQWQAWTKDALEFPDLKIDLVSAYIWNENISNTVHN